MTAPIVRWVHVLAHLATTAAGLGGGHGLGRFLIRRLILHTLLRSGGWILVLAVVVGVVVLTQLNRRRRR